MKVTVHPHLVLMIRIGVGGCGRCSSTSRYVYAVRRDYLTHTERSVYSNVWKNVLLQ